MTPERTNIRASASSASISVHRAPYRAPRRQISVYTVSGVGNNTTRVTRGAVVCWVEEVEVEVEAMGCLLVEAMSFCAPTR